MRGVSLDEISAATRIATRFLQAIENEQWDQLPGGVFNRGFIRAVARYLGLDEEDTVAEYAAAIGDRPSVPVWTGSPPAVVPDQPWLAWIITAVVALLLLAGVWFGVRHLSAWRAARRAATISASAVPSVERLNTSPATSSSPLPAEPLSNLPVGAPPSTGAPDINPVSVPTAVSESPVITSLDLKIETVEKTRVTIDVDGQRAYDGNIKTGDERSFTAKDNFEVATPNAGALLLELNGKILAPIGPRGHSGKVTLTRDSLKEVAGGNN